LTLPPSLAHLDVSQPVPLLRRRAECLCQHREAFRFDRRLSCLRPKERALYPYEVTQVNCVQQALVGLNADALLLEITLNTPGPISKVHKRSSPHLPNSRHAPRHRGDVATARGALEQLDGRLRR